jgi:hypothetical protein
MKALDARQELAKPTVAALVVLAVAGVAWAVMVQHSRSMAGMAGMDMGLSPIESFAATWVVMMAALNVECWLRPASGARSMRRRDQPGHGVACLRDAGERLRGDQLHVANRVGIDT